METNTSPPLPEFIIKMIAKKYNVLIFIGLTKDNDVYVRLDKIYIINKKFLFINDTGYGKTYELACLDLIKLFLNTDYRIRYNELYATSAVRYIIKACCKKYNKKVGELHEYH